MNSLRLLCFALLLTACGTTTSGGGGFSITPGTPCDAATQHELCSGIVRLSCVSGVWQALEACGQGQMCVSLPGAPGTATTTCAQITPQGDGASFDVAMPDIGSFDVNLQPDIPTTVDVPKTGCVTKTDCDDGIACTTDNCLNGICQHLTQDAVCNEGDPCSIGKCNTLNGCTKTPKSGACDDGDNCTTGDSCKAGTCTGTPINCDDGNACTSDSCSNGGCQYQPVAGCSDDTFAGATLLTVGKPATGALDPTGDVDFYKFDGVKGQLVYIQVVTSQTTQKKPMDPSIIDTVLTMYGPDQQPYAFDDDPSGVAVNDSEIWTILPQTGTYWLKVEECWTFVASQPGSTAVCAPPQSKSDTQYQLNVGVVSPSMSPSIVLDAETGDSINNTTTAGFEKTPDGLSYYVDILYGFFKNGVDVDPFAMTPPLDVKVTQGRATLFVRGLPGGVQGDGSSCDPGVISALIPGTSGVLAQSDLATGLLEVPVTLGQKIVLMNKHGTGAMGSNDFYVLIADVGDSGPIEKADAANNVPSGAEVLTVASGSSASGSTYYIAGDITQKGADVDHFSFAVPSGTWTVTVFCTSSGIGSGVQGFGAALLDANGNALPGATNTEATSPQEVTNFPVPAGTKTLILKTSATGQSAAVTGTFYRCTVDLKAP